MRVMVNGLLSAWGDWAVRGEDGGVGWAKCSPMFRDIPSGHCSFESKPPPGIGRQSSECEVTDQAVRMLKDQDVRLFDVCMAFYKPGVVKVDRARGEKLTGQKVADHLGLSKRTMYVRLETMKQRILGNLNDLGAGC